MVPATTSLTGFSGETIWPLGQLRFLITIGDTEHYTKAWMNFMIVRSPSPYNSIIGRLGLREIQVVPSTTHGMLKILVNGGIVTICSTILMPTECATIAATPKETTKKAEARHENHKVAIHPDFPDQEITIGGTVLTKARTKLCTLLKGNLDIFTWKSSDMTGVPRSTRYPRRIFLCQTEKRGQAPKRAKAIQVEVQKLVEAGILREIYYHDWLSNPVMVRKHDGSWRMFVDFTYLNKACPQDCYPLPEIDWKVESLCEYPFKCFLDAYKGYHQIQIAKQDEEKTAFHNSHRTNWLEPGDMRGRLGHQEPHRNRAATIYRRNVTPEGIKLCPDKTEAVLQLLSPWTIKEVQSLNGKLASLNRFLSKSAEKSLPLFKTLKKCIENPDTGLFREPGAASSRAKLYPNGKDSPGASLRRQKILADFLIEKSDDASPEASVIETPQELWTLFTNGSSCVDGSGAGLILTSPEGT
ncbi:hypothetical protein Tco_1008316 [Tanacetum coccineum]